MIYLTFKDELFTLERRLNNFSVLTISHRYMACYHPGWKVYIGMLIH